MKMTNQPANVGYVRRAQVHTAAALRKSELLRERGVLRVPMITQPAHDTYLYISHQHCANPYS